MPTTHGRKAINFDLNDNLLKNILKAKILYTVSILVMFQMILSQWLML